MHKGGLNLLEGIQEIHLIKISIAVITGEYIEWIYPWCIT